MSTILQAPLLFDPDAPSRQRRPLHSGPGEVYPVDMANGGQVRLTRYHGGDNGPVLLSHGLGVSSRIFTTDTIDRNLTEFLVEHGYDVWLLDFHTSTDLPSAALPYTADEVAKYDYPAAVDKVREITGAPDVQILAHCYGATTFTLAVLEGLQNVRTAILSQISTDVVVPRLTRIKAKLFLAELFDKIGVSSLTAYVDTKRRWGDKLLDAALMFYPAEAEEQARNPVHRRNAFLYGGVYRLHQLNDATFRALHELFGVANIHAFKQLAAMIRAQHVVDAGGRDVYLTEEKLKRFNFPTLIIHGERNGCFLPESTERTIERLTRANPQGNYRRVVIPEYGHIDCIFGKNAHRDVYPHFLEHLEQTARQEP